MVDAPDSPHERLAWARARAGYEDKAHFAKVVGVNPTTYRAYENGQNGFAKFAATFAKRLGVTAEWLLEGGPLPSGPPPVASDQPVTRSADAGETAEVIRLDLSLPMGTGATIDDYIEEEPFTFDLGYLRSFTRTPAHRLRLATGVGDSMFPTLLPSDAVWIDSTQTVLNQTDKIWAVSINGGAAIKRLRPLKDGRVLIMSDNKTVGDYEVGADELLIGGRIIKFSRDL